MNFKFKMIQEDRIAILQRWTHYKSYLDVSHIFQSI